MMVFNSYISGILGNACWDQAEDLDHSLLASNGRLARVRPPKWAQRAVFFRDRGRCVLCEKDLTGLMSIDNVENYDHIVPISGWGINRSEEHTSELQSLMRISYAVFCLKKKI